MRLRNDPHAKEKLIQSKLYIEDYPFTIKDNTIIELGMGKGEMITELAKRNPNNNFLGIEKFLTVAAKAANKALDLKINNFNIICEDIKDMNELLIGKVNVLWLTFSDPWPKARHEKRRLTYKKFLNIYKTFLSENGCVKFKTDNDKLFEYSIESFKENGWILKNVTHDFHNHSSSKDNVMTGYEKKWSDNGKNINYLEAYIK